MASKNLIKNLFLLLVTLISIGLLTFCLASNCWLKINETKLKATQSDFESAYLAFNEGKSSDILLKSQEVVVKKEETKQDEPRKDETPKTENKDVLDDNYNGNYDDYSYTYDEPVKSNTRTKRACKTYYVF